MVIEPWRCNLIWKQMHNIKIRQLCNIFSYILNHKFDFRRIQLHNTKTNCHLQLQPFWKNTNWWSKGFWSISDNYSILKTYRTDFYFMLIWTAHPCRNPVYLKYTSNGTWKYTSSVLKIYFQKYTWSTIILVTPKVYLKYTLQVVYFKYTSHEMYFKYTSHKVYLMYTTPWSVLQVYLRHIVKDT